MLSFCSRPRAMLLTIMVLFVIMTVHAVDFRDLTSFLPPTIDHPVAYLTATAYAKFLEGEPTETPKVTQVILNYLPPVNVEPNIRNITIDCTLYDLTTMTPIFHHTNEGDQFTKYQYWAAFDQKFYATLVYTQLRCNIGIVSKESSPPVVVRESMGIFEASFVYNNVVHNQEIGMVFVTQLIEIAPSMNNAANNTTPLAKILTNKAPFVMAPSEGDKFGGFIHPEWKNATLNANNFTFSNWQFAIDAPNSHDFAHSLLNHQNVSIMRLSYSGEGWFTTNARNGDRFCYINGIAFNTSMVGESLEIDLRSGGLDAFFSANIYSKRNATNFSSFLLHILSIDCKRNFPIVSVLAATTPLNVPAIHLEFGERIDNHFLPFTDFVGATRVLLNANIQPKDYLSPTASIAYAALTTTPNYTKYIPQSAIAFAHSHQDFDMVKCSVSFSFTVLGKREFRDGPTPDLDLDTVTITLPGDFHPIAPFILDQAPFVTLSVGTGLGSGIRTIFIIPQWKSFNQDEKTTAYTQTTFQFLPSSLFTPDELVVDDINDYFITLESIVYGSFFDVHQNDTTGGKQCIFELSHNAHKNTLPSTTVLTSPLPIQYLHQELVSTNNTVAALEVSHVLNSKTSQTPLNETLSYRLVNHAYHRSADEHTITSQRVIHSWPRKTILPEVMPGFDAIPSQNVAYSSATFGSSPLTFYQELTGFADQAPYSMEFSPVRSVHPHIESEFVSTSCAPDITNEQASLAAKLAPWIVTTHVGIKMKKTDQISRSIPVLSTWPQNAEIIYSTIGKIPSHALPHPNEDSDDEAMSNGKKILVIIISIIAIASAAAIFFCAQSAWFRSKTADTVDDRKPLISTSVNSAEAV